MKKRNKYWGREKEYLRLEEQLNNNQKIQWNLGYKELEEPIPYGFNCYYVLRDDISRREDAWVFKTILKLCGKSAWRRKNNFHINFKRDKYNFYQYPHFIDITKEQYEKQVSAVKKWLFEWEDKWGRIYYYHTIPQFYFIYKIEQNYKTEVRIIDEVLKQEEAFLKDKLQEYYNKGYDNWGYQNKFGRKQEHKHRRVEFRNERNILMRRGIDLMYYCGEDIEKQIKYDELYYDKNWINYDSLDWHHWCNNL